MRQGDLDCPQPRGLRLRTNFSRRWTGYLTLVLLVGPLGGLGLGSLAATRRTRSSFSTFLAGTKASNPLESIYSGNDGRSGNPNYSAALLEAIKRLPHVRHVAAGVELTGAPLTAEGSPRLSVTRLAYPVGSVNGLFFTLDRLAVTQGRAASPNRPDEITLAPAVAKLLGFHVGQVIPFGFYSGAQQSLPGFGIRPGVPADQALVVLRRVVAAANRVFSSEPGGDLRQRHRRPRSPASGGDRELPDDRPYAHAARLWPGPGEQWWRWPSLS